MSWYNYKAFSINTSLSGSAIIPAAELEESICGLSNRTLYHCYYDLEKRDTFTEYAGIMRPVFNTIHFDFDSKDDGGLAAWEDTKRFCAKLASGDTDFVLYFSGNKGFHVAVHASCLGITEGPKEEIEQVVKSILFSLKPEYSTLDTGIWNANRKFRAWRSRHEKSGLYKVRLAHGSTPSLGFTIEDIRALAASQPAVGAYVHPAAGGQATWLLTNATPQHPPASKSQVKEIQQGSTIEDDSLKFKNFSDKKCMKQMLSGTLLPQFNRHDIELALIVELRQVGKTLDEATGIMESWSKKVYKLEPDRASDVPRQVRDIYSKQLEADKLYQYGCYGDIKSAYCSAKCKIYNSLDNKRRPEPLDCTKTQKAENEVRRNPNLALSEGMIADKILAELGSICTSNQEYFRWENTHWARIDRERFVYMIKQACINAYKNQATTSQIMSLYVHTLAKIPVAPESNCFFATSPDKFNFTDGTCHITKNAKGSVKLEMLPHDPKDMLSYCAPFPLYGEEALPRSGDFKHFVEMKKGSLGDHGIRALKELFGAALIPYEPRVFFLLGESNAGKSTAAIIIERLLGAENVSSCDPTSDYQFEWEPSIGKIANIRRELPPRRPLQDDKLKEFRDKRPIGIQRKGIKGVMATVPFLHVYCCNKLPPSLEGNTGALDNRITLLKFTKDYANGFGEISNLGDWLWDRDAGGILDFAREGLKLLIENNFQYCKLRDSSENLQEWQDETDPVKLYFMEVADGERKLRVDYVQNGWILGMAIYDDFKKWSAERNFYAMSHIRFYKELSRCGVKGVKKTEQGKVFLWEAKGLESSQF